MRVKLYMPFHFGNKALQLCGRAFSAVRSELCGPFRLRNNARPRRIPYNTIVVHNQISFIGSMMRRLPSGRFSDQAPGRVLTLPLGPTARETS